MMKKAWSEAIRKSIHFGSLVIPFTYRYILGYNRLLMFVLLLVSLITVLMIEFYRMEVQSFRKLFHSLFGLILRKHERLDFTGATFLIFSSLICVVFFKPIIAFLAICYLAIGDTFAAIIGMTLGKRKYNAVNKSVEGSLACFTSIMIFSFIFGIELSPWVFVLGCVAATWAELWILPLDDNIKIPLLSGLVMSLVNIIV